MRFLNFCRNGESQNNRGEKDILKVQFNLYKVLDAQARAFEDPFERLGPDDVS
jgi:hypothetical protein